MNTMNKNTNIIFLDTHPVETINNNNGISDSLNLEKSVKIESNEKQAVKEVYFSYRFIVE